MSSNILVIFVFFACLQLYCGHVAYCNHIDYCRQTARAREHAHILLICCWNFTHITCALQVHYFDASRLNLLPHVHCSRRCVCACDFFCSVFFFFFWALFFDAIYLCTKPAYMGGDLRKCLKLLLYEALSCCCIRPWATAVCSLKLLVHAAFRLL